MSEPKPSLHIDSDWKKQAQEEKRKLAEKEKVATPATAATSAPIASGATQPVAAGKSAAARTAREMPPASFATLVQSVVTQALYYLGDLSPRGAEPALNLDMAKTQIDLLGVLEAKTLNNLDADEKRLLDSALYETRMRFVSVSQQFLGP